MLNFLVQPGEGRRKALELGGNRTGWKTENGAFRGWNGNGNASYVPFFVISDVLPSNIIGGKNR